ncbi:MAG: iron-containing alcohol dehydrogenase [Rickettsiales bacterium]|jgi:alcohol dehydrogenase|nr:iron-containing alcohol dehydrogenase [Rickettsiales bacterium]
MENYRFFIPTYILFGKGQLENLHKQQLPGKKALIVIGGSSVRKYGYLDRVQEQLAKANITFVVYDKVQPNPTKKCVEEAAEVARNNECDFVVGLGGGSPIDAAKAIAVLAANGGDLWDYYKNRKIPIRDPLPIVAITTTAGTGTEADPWTVITNSETNDKIGFGYKKTFPILSIVDPSLMMTIPPHLTAYQGFDALFHSMEGYINVRANPISDMFALRAIELIGTNLPVAVNDGKNEIARENMALASTLSGVVESLSGCISEHSLEHALSGYHPDLPHGAGLIMISKEYFTYFAEASVCDQKLISMARALGNKNAVKSIDLVDELVKLQKACGVSNLKMSDYSVEKNNLEKYTKKAYEAMGGLFKCDPKELSVDEATKILAKSYR